MYYQAPARQPLVSPEDRMTLGHNRLKATTVLAMRRQPTVFVNEAAYAEKSIALSLTRREVWPVEPTWLPALQQLLSAA